MLVGSAERCLVDYVFEELHGRIVHVCGYSRKEFRWIEDLKKCVIAWFMLVYYRILMVCRRGSKNGKGGNG